MIDPLPLYRKITSFFPMQERWLDEFRASALFIDTETSQILPTDGGKLIELGFSIVIDGKLTASDDLIIQTPYCPMTWGAAYLNPVLNNLLKVRCGDKYAAAIREIDENSGSIYDVPLVPDDIKNMASKKDGIPLFATAYDITNISADRTMREGVDRIDALKWMQSLIDTMHSSGGQVLAGHNHVNFDLMWFAYEFDKYLNIGMEIHESLLWDTGMFVKGLKTELDMLPNQSVYDYYRDVSDARSSAKWSLDSSCIKDFSLDEIDGVDPDRQHESAAYDCEVSYILTKAVAAGRKLNCETTKPTYTPRRSSSC